MTTQKGTPAHYRQRIERLRRRADYLRAMLARGERSEGSVHHITAEISALNWAVATLAPWFAKDEEPQSPEVFVTKPRRKNPWLEDAAVGATGETYEIRNVWDFLKVPEDRRRICLREFHSAMVVQEGTTAMLTAVGDAMDTGVKPEDLHWQNDVFRWHDDGKACISVQMQTPPASVDAVDPVLSDSQELSVAVEKSECEAGAGEVAHGQKV